MLFIVFAMQTCRPADQLYHKAPGFRCFCTWYAVRFGLVIDYRNLIRGLGLKKPYSCVSGVNTKNVIAGLF